MVGRPTAYAKNVNNNKTRTAVFSGHVLIITSRAIWGEKSPASRQMKKKRPRRSRNKVRREKDKVVGRRDFFLAAVQPWSRWTKHNNTVDDGGETTGSETKMWLVNADWARRALGYNNDFHQLKSVELGLVGNGTVNSWWLKKTAGIYK